MKNRAILIAAGGSGTRLWPLFTKKKPKQFVTLLGGKSLLRQTFDRIRSGFDIQNIHISTRLEFKQLILDEIP